jgi:hypothetical protein
MAISPTRKRITWKAARAERIVGLRLLVTVLTDAVFLASFEVASFLHASFVQQAATRAVAVVSGWFGPLAHVIGAQRVKAAMGGSPALAVLVTGFAAGCWRSRTVAARLHDTLFATFNYDVLWPVRRPQALDPLWGGTVAGGAHAMLRRAGA